MNEKYIRRIFTLIDIGVGVDSHYETIYKYMCVNLKNTRFVGLSNTVMYNNAIYVDKYEKVALYDTRTENIYLFNSVYKNILVDLFKLENKSVEVIMGTYLKHKLNL